MEFDIHKCICGRSVDVSCKNVYDYTFVAFIVCDCGLKIEEYSSSVGFGTTKVQLCKRVIDKWNKSMVMKDKKGDERK